MHSAPKMPKLRRRNVISAEQIKAARALKNWSQEDLSKVSGLSLSTIHALENGTRSLRSSDQIRKAFEDHGVEFIGTTGLNRIADEHKSYNGPDGCERFFSDLVATLRDKGGDIAVTCKTPDLFVHAFNLARVDLGRVEQLGKIARIRCLLSKPRESLLSTLDISFVQFRAFTGHTLSPWSTFHYGNKTTVVIPNGMDTTYIIMKSVLIAQRERAEFDAAWDAALPFVAKGGDSERRYAT